MPGEVIGLDKDEEGITRRADIIANVAKAKIEQAEKEEEKKQQDAIQFAYAGDKPNCEVCGSPAKNACSGCSIVHYW